MNTGARYIRLLKINLLLYQSKYFQIELKEQEVNAVQEKIKIQRGKFAKLLEEKQGLDLEISVYRKLVESEEERLKIKQGILLKK